MKANTVKVLYVPHLIFVLILFCFNSRKKEKNPTLKKQEKSVKKFLNFPGSPKEMVNADLNSLMYTLISNILSIRAVCDEFCGL